MSSDIPPRVVRGSVGVEPPIYRQTAPPPHRIWIVALALLSLVPLSIFVLIVLPMFGIGGDATEHGSVAFDVHPSGDEIVFSSATGDLFLYRLESKKVTRLTETPEEETSPRFSPDGTRIAFSISTEAGNRIAEMPTTGGAATILTKDNGASDFGPDYSPDGERLAFTRAFRHRPYSLGGMVWDDYDVCVLDLETGKVKRLTRASYYQASSVEFDRTGSQVFYVADAGYGSNGPTAYAISSSGDGTRPSVRLTPPPRAYAGGAWISDVRGDGGNRVVFISDRDRPYEYDLYVAEKDQAPRALGVTGVSRYNQNPVFDPNGNGILFLSQAGSNRHSRPIFRLSRVGLSGKVETVAETSLFSDPLTMSKTR